MQVISAFMDFDTIALRQKNAIWKVDGYNIRSVYGEIICFYLFLMSYLRKRFRSALSFWNWEYRFLIRLTRKIWIPVP